MIELYWKPETVADVVAMALRLIAVEHRIVTVGEDVTEEEYLRINPSGTVPAMVEGDLVLFESVAILMYLADQHPDAGLAPAPGTPEHALYDRWLAFILANLMGAYYRWYHGDEMIDGEHLEALKNGAERDVNAISRRIESELGRVRQERLDAEQAKTLVADLVIDAARIGSLLQTATTSETRDLLRSIVQEVVVNPDTNEAEMTFFAIPRVGGTDGDRHAEHGTRRPPRSVR